MTIQYDKTISAWNKNDSSELRIRCGHKGWPAARYVHQSTEIRVRRVVHSERIDEAQINVTITEVKQAASGRETMHQHHGSLHLNPSETAALIAALQGKHPTGDEP